MDVIEEAEVETPERFDTIKGKRTWRLSEGGKVLTIEDSPLLESLRDTDGFAEFRQEVARRRAIMKRRLAAD